MGRMAPLTRRPPKTVEDYMALPDDVRAELIGGELYVTPSPTPLHQDVIGRLYRILTDVVERQTLGRVFLAPLDVHLPSGDVVQPDLLFIAAGHETVIQDWIRGVPDLVVEVVSPTHAERDRSVKRDLYARNGTPELWLVDPQERSVEIVRNEGGTWRPLAFLGPTDRLRSPSLPGLDAPVADVFP
jgi:Uma2 family endonuclease